MKRFVIAAALAAVLGLGFADTAQAQYVRGYTTITPSGGIATGGMAVGPGAYQTYNNYYAPNGNVYRKAYYTDVLGNSYGQSYGYNFFNGTSFNRGFVQPSPLLYPFAGPAYNYNFYRRAW